MTAAHSKIGASSMYRWSVCPGSVRLSEGLRTESSRYAEEGSDAHALAAYVMRGQAPNAMELIGKEVRSDGRKFTVDLEMAEAVTEYVDSVSLDVNPVNGDVLVVEQRFDLSEVHPGLFGTADAVTWRPKDQMLIVDDFKYGAGIPVDVKNNPQLMYYGLGALLASNYPAKTVRLRITQPRCDHADGPVRWWDIDAIDLIDFKADLKRFAQATEKPDAPIVSGSHCRFCPAAKNNACPALAQQAQDIAKLEFSPAKTYDPMELKRALDSREIVKAWLKNLDEFAYAEAEAGRVPPGYKLVAKRATRKWKAEGDIIEAAQDLGVKDEVLFEPRAVKSPAQLEKALGKDFIAPFVIAESSGHVLAPESDKRPAIVRTSAAEDFASLTAAKG